MKRLHTEGHRLVDERLIFETALAQRNLVDSARKTTRKRRNKERLQHLQAIILDALAASDSAQAIRRLIPASFWGGGVVVNEELLSHLHAPYRAYALLSASERIQWIRQDRWIHYSRAEQVLNRLSDLLTYPARDRMPCLLLFGPTGMGKTRIVQKFLREHRSGFDDLNAIRFLANDLRIPLVCVGTHEAKQALMTDQQLADRFEAWELPPWQDDPALLQLLASFTAILPLRQASELRDPKIRKRVLVLTEGVMVRICRLLEAAAIQAIETEHEHINLQMLTGGFDHGNLGIHLGS